MARISKRFTFEAAHRLLRHEGKCRTLHGHSYKVDVEIIGSIQDVVLERELYQTSGKINPQGGMVLDFSALNGWWKDIEQAFDHITILENSDPLVSILREAGQIVAEFAWTPTAENLATWLREDLQNWLLKQPGFDGGFQTPVVRVWETEKSWAEA